MLLVTCIVLQDLIFFILLVEYVSCDDSNVINIDDDIKVEPADLSEVKTKAKSCR